MIIGIHGKLRSGKDTVARLLSEKFIELGFKTRKRAFADSLREVVEKIICVERKFVDDSYSTQSLDFTEEQKNTYIPEFDLTIGQMLQHLGTETMRDHFNINVWVNSLWLNIKDIYENEIVIVTDVRFINEVKFLRDTGCILINVEGKPTTQTDESTRDKNHSSETSLDSFNEYDFVIKNDGTLDELKNKINFISTQILEHYRHIYNIT